MRAVVGSLLIMGATVGAAPAGPFDGLYKQSADADCALGVQEGGALRVEDNVFHGIEAQCKMTAPTDVRGMNAVLYDMVCEGEGLEWIERAMFLVAADGGLILVWNGFAFQYERCPDPSTPQDTTPETPMFGPHLPPVTPPEGEGKIAPAAVQQPDPDAD